MTAGGLHPLGPGMLSAALALNAAHEAQTGPLDMGALQALCAQAFHVRAAGGGADAILIALDQSAFYHSPNFLWFRERFAQFVYVDRVIVSPAKRGRGLARRLYADLFDAAARAGHVRVCCEVNVDPPNPASDAFHAATGFSVIGQRELADRGKTVRYMARRLPVD